MTENGGGCIVCGKESKYLPRGLCTAHYHAVKRLGVQDRFPRRWRGGGSREQREIEVQMWLKAHEQGEAGASP